MKSRNRERTALRTRTWAAVAVLGVSLVMLAVTPALVSVRTHALRETITEVAEPTISAVSGIERSILGQLAALRGYALTGDSAFVRDYADLRVEERQEMARLYVLANELDPEVDRHAVRLGRLADEWHEAVADRLAANGADASRSAVSSLDPTALRSEARSLRRSTELLERLRRRDIAEVETLEVWLNRIMIALAAVAAVSLGVLGRRLHDLAATSQADRDRLASEVSRRARLIRGLSHDLKNPLGVADAHAELLELGVKGDLQPEQHESLGAIRRSVQSTVRLIDDLLHLARAERGEIPVRPLPVDFTKLVGDVAADARSKANSDGLQLNVDVPSAPIPGVTDPERVREVIGNLLSNAIRYTPPGGRISVALEPIGHSPGSDRVLISVRDNGPGISPMDQERIFEEFERAGQAGDGSGLGLAISREIAGLMGGEIRLDSEVGSGSTFTLVLPRELERLEKQAVT